MPKIYHTSEGWRVRGFSGTTFTKAQAQERLAREKRKFSGLGFVKPSYKSLKAYEKKIGGMDAMTGKVLTFSNFKELATSAKAFFRRDEPRREAIVRAKQQKKLSGYF